MGAAQFWAALSGFAVPQEQLWELSPSTSGCALSEELLSKLLQVPPGVTQSSSAATAPQQSLSPGARAVSGCEHTPAVCGMEVMVVMDLTAALHCRLCPRLHWPDYNVILPHGFLSAGILLQKVQVLFVSLSLGGILAEREVTWKSKKGCRGEELILGPT